MGSTVRHWAWVALTVLIAVDSIAPSFGLAQDANEPAGYRDAIEEAVLEFGAGNFDESRSLFTRAHALYPTARTYRGLGQVEFELRNYVACIEQLEAALRSHELPLEGELRDDTERLLVRANGFVGRYVIDLVPRTAQLTVDGVGLAVTTDPLVVLKVGDHQVEVEAAGYTPERRVLRTHGGEHETVSVVLGRLAASSEELSVRRTWYKNPWVWAAVGALVATTAVATGLALRDRTEEAYGGTSRTVVTGPR
jgi:tetratricopeptide (TPR) repeat protein